VESIFESIFRRRSVAVVSYCLCAVIVFTMWVWGADTPSTAINDDPRTALSGLLEGTANNPFVQRALVPLLTQGLYRILPETAWFSVRSALMAIPKVQKETARLGWETSYLPKYLIAFSLAFLSLFLFMFVFRALYRQFYETTAGVVNAVPLVALIALPPFFHVGTHYIYDFPALLFFTWGILLILRRDWKWFYPVYFLGCLNKETSVFLVAAYLILHGRKDARATLLAHIFAQLGIFALVKSVLILTFRNNPGGSLEFHLWFNLGQMLHPYSIGALGITLIAATLFFYDLEKKPPAAKRLAWLAVPFCLIALVFGYYGEIRAFYELFPIALVLMSHTVFYTIWKIPFRCQAAYQGKE
jgi:hypothetical protein